jgi:hypothetical protein
LILVSIFEKRLDANNNVKEIFIESGFIADAFRAFRNDWWFQYDNTPPHIANLTKSLSS